MTRDPKSCWLWIEFEMATMQPQRRKYAVLVAICAPDVVALLHFIWSLSAMFCIAGVIGRQGPKGGGGGRGSHVSPGR